MKFVVPEELLANQYQEFTERPIRTHENVPQMDLRNSSKMLLIQKVSFVVNLTMDERENVT